MLSESDKQRVRRNLAEALLRAAPGNGPWKITLRELAVSFMGPRATLVGHALREHRELFAQELLNVLHEQTGEPKWALADPAEYLHNFSYYASRITGGGGIRQFPATIEFKRWPMTARKRVEVANV